MMCNWVRGWTAMALASKQEGSRPPLKMSNAKRSSSGVGGTNVVVHPEACCIMALHASQHRHETVRGFLVGTASTASAAEGTSAAAPATAVQEVRWAVPVAHGPVTGPLVELAMGLCEAMPLFGSQNGNKLTNNHKVVGWYTAPSLLQASDSVGTAAGPVDVRVASGLDGGLLLVMNNEALGSVMKGDDGSVSKLFVAASSAPGRSQQVVVVRESAKAGRAAREAMQQGVTVEDFVDHLECSSAAESTWLCYDSIEDLIKKC